MILSPFIALFSLAGLGYLCKYLRIIKQEDSDTLVDIVLYITLPATIINSFISINVESSHAKLVLLGIISTFLIIGLAAVIYKFFFKNKVDYSTAVPLAFFSNAGFLGLPVMQTLFGNEGISLAIPFQVFSSGEIFIFTIGAFIMLYYSPIKHTKKIGALLKKNNYYSCHLSYSHWHYSSLPNSTLIPDTYIRFNSPS